MQSQLSQLFAGEDQPILVPSGEEFDGGAHKSKFAWSQVGVSSEKMLSHDAKVAHIDPHRIGERNSGRIAGYDRADLSNSP
jgi:hypothetical protein